jgi:hypothetical protein
MKASLNGRATTPGPVISKRWNNFPVILSNELMKIFIPLILLLIPLNVLSQQETRYACSDSDKASVKKYFAETDENNKVLSDMYFTRNTGERTPLSFCWHGCVVSLPMPAFPAIARRDRLRGVIIVEAIADEKGNIFFAKAVSGPSIFRNSAVKAACSSKFKPIAFGGKTLKFRWDIIYNFIQ